MRKRLVGLAVVATLVAAIFSFWTSAGLARGPAKRKLLYLTLSAGFRHDVIPFSTGIVKDLGEKSGEFEATIATDVAGFTAENLKNYDAIMFYTTGELPMSNEQKDAFIHYIQSGHGFVGVHSATDTFYMWEPYLNLIGGYFNDHPWHQVVTVDVVDPSDPIVCGLPSSFQINDEIYQISDFQADTSHVLLKLDPGSVDLKKGGVRPRFYGWPMAWTRRDGDGRVFYTGLGHEQSTWEDPRFQKLLLNGIKWAMGDLK
jgi:uncharacterized protein